MNVKKEVVYLVNVGKGSFKDRLLRETDDIELLRKAYEDLLEVYQEEIRERVLLEVRIEHVIDNIK